MCVFCITCGVRGQCPGRLRPVGPPGTAEMICICPVQMKGLGSRRPCKWAFMSSITEISSLFTQAEFWTSSGSPGALTQASGPVLLPLWNLPL